MQFDHIGVVVEEIAEGRSFLESAFGITRWTEVFDDPGIGVYVQFGMGSNGPCYELIAPREEKSPISVALRTGKAILNHVAYLVPDLDAAAEKLCNEGAMPVSEAQPAVAYEQQRVQFFLSPLRFIVELIEAPEHLHKFVSSERVSQ